MKSVAETMMLMPSDGKHVPAPDIRRAFRVSLPSGSSFRQSKSGATSNAANGQRGRLAPWRTARKLSTLHQSAAKCLYVSGPSITPKCRSGIKHDTPAVNRITAAAYRLQPRAMFVAAPCSAPGARMPDQQSVSMQFWRDTRSKGSREVHQCVSLPVIMFGFGNRIGDPLTRGALQQARLSPGRSCARGNLCVERGNVSAHRGKKALRIDTHPQHDRCNRRHHRPLALGEMSTHRRCVFVLLRAKGDPTVEIEHVCQRQG